MSKIIDRAGKGAAISASENDANLDALHGINTAVAGTTYTVTVADQGDTLEFTSASAVAVTLTSIATIIGNADTSDFKVTLLTTGAGTVTITPNGANTINNGDATIVLTTDDYVTIQTDSTALIWNIIEHSDSRTLDGLDSTAFAQLAVANTFIENQALEKASPALTVNATTGGATINLQDAGTTEGYFTWDDSSAVKLVKINPGVVAALSLTDAGKVDVETGDLQIGGTDISAIYAALASANTFTAVQRIDVDGAALTLDTVASNSALIFQKSGVTRSQIYDSQGATALIFAMYDLAGTTQVANLYLTRTGKVNIATGDFQIGGTDISAIYAALAVANEFTADQKISKNTAAFVLNTTGAGAPQINFRSSDVNKALIFWEPSGDELILRQVDSAVPATVRAEIKLTELGKVNVSTGTLQLAGADITSTAAELNLLDGSVAGTAVASKALVLGATKNIDTIDVTKDGLEIGGTAMTCTAAELNTLDGITSTTAELNILDGVTSTAAELNILDGVTSTAAELNILDGVTSTTAELNILDGVTSTAAELSITDGDSADSSVVIVDADQFIINNGGVMEQTAATDVALYTKNENNAGLNTKIIDIGDWNMDTTATIGVNHGLTLSKIRTLTATVRNDADTNYYDLLMYDAAATGFNVIQSGTTSVSLTRAISGFFDGTDFDSTSYNRGWLIIQYID